MKKRNMVLDWIGDSLSVCLSVFENDDADSIAGKI